MNNSDKPVNVKKGKQGFQPTEKAEAVAKPLGGPVPELPEGATVEAGCHYGWSEAIYTEPLGDGHEFRVITIWDVEERIDDDLNQTFVVTHTKSFNIYDSEDNTKRDPIHHVYDDEEFDGMEENKANDWANAMASGYVASDVVNDTYAELRHLFDQ